MIRRWGGTGGGGDEGGESRKGVVRSVLLLCVILEFLRENSDNGLPGGCVTLDGCVVEHTSQGACRGNGEGRGKRRNGVKEAIHGG